MNAVERLEQTVPLSDVRTLVLFDLLFLGRPGADGQLQPLFDPQDASKDDLIESIISDLSHATRPYQDTDGALLAPTTANILVAEVPT